MRISRASIESVQERASLIDVAGEIVKLRRQGSSMVGLCPFHSERSPSFHIRDNGKYFHCFGCGAAGNVISFVMQIRGLSFPDAVAELAQRFGITLEHEKGSGPVDKGQEGARAAEREQLLKLNALAQQWFLEHARRAASPAPAYLLERGVGVEAIEEFGIGYAVPEFAALHQEFTKRKVPAELELKSGLVRRSERGEVYDTFRSRITFPIFDERKRILGFGGRLIAAAPDSRAPKYLNSPETPLYEKSKIFYGLPHSLAQLRSTKEAIIVEGYFDVVGLWQAGVRRAIATCGTALTESHVKRLVHLVNRVVLLFDGDAAGVAAAGKVFPLFVNSGLDVQVMALPAGEDPDTFALRCGDQTEAALSKLLRRPLLDCYLDYLAAGAGLAAGQSPHQLPPAAKGKVAAQVGAVVQGIKNEVERGELLERASRILKVPIDALQKLSHSTSPAGHSSGQTVAASLQENEESGSRSGGTSSDVPPGIERSLLASVMALKGELPGMVLADAGLCELLSPVTIEFISAFQTILKDSRLTDPQRKDATRVLLTTYGAAWVALWREAHAQNLGGSEGLDLDAVLKHGRMVAKRQRIKGLIAELEQGIALTADDKEKLSLTKAKIDLVRQLQVVTAPSPT